MKRLLLVPALGVVGLVLASPASAQFAGTIDLNRPTYTDEARQPYNESRRVAYDNGYREGIREGERDGRSRDAFNYQDERTWQRADKGYHRSLRRLGALSAVVPDRATRPATRTAIDGTRPTTAIAATATAASIRTRAAAIRSQGSYGYPGQGGYGAPGQAAATATARRTRMARTTATRRAARTRAIATRTIRCATSGTAKATTTTRASTARASSTRTSIARASRKATNAATGSGRIR